MKIDEVKVVGDMVVILVLVVGKVFDWDFEEGKIVKKGDIVVKIKGE